MAKRLLILILFLLSLKEGNGFDLIVARDGSGNFTTIQEAIDAAPTSRMIGFQIKVKVGVYGFFVVPLEKPRLSLIGDGAEVTIVTGSRSNRTGFRTRDTASAQIFGDDFIAQYISFRNTAGASAGQGVALLVDASRAAFYRCKFDGFQDTLYINQVQFYRECGILGTVDFIFGDGKVVLQNCNIYFHQPAQQQKNTIVAQHRSSLADNTGIVLHNYTITSAPDFDASSRILSYLGRPWGDYATTVVMESYLPSLIDLEGWLEWNSQTRYRLDQLYYREYNNRGPGARTDERVKWKGYQVITNVSEAEKFTVRNFLNGMQWLPSTKIPFFPILLGNK